MMYACKLDIKYEPQIVVDKKEYLLSDDIMNIQDLLKYIGPEDRFHLMPNEDDIVVLTVLHERLETVHETEARIRKAEEYNREYDKFWAKHTSGPK